MGALRTAPLMRLRKKQRDMLGFDCRARSHSYQLAARGLVSASQQLDAAVTRWCLAYICLVAAAVNVVQKSATRAASVAW
eukprot:2066308-Alexandrium_andersonii.AAC.1